MRNKKIVNYSRFLPGMLRHTENSNPSLLQEFVSQCHYTMDKV